MKWLNLYHDDHSLTIRALSNGQGLSSTWPTGEAIDIVPAATPTPAPIAYILLSGVFANELNGERDVSGVSMLSNCYVVNENSASLYRHYSRLGCSRMRSDSMILFDYLEPMVQYFLSPAATLAFSITMTSAR